MGVMLRLIQTAHIAFYALIREKEKQGIVMKIWQLVLVQLWVLCFTPMWVFILIFAPLVLAPPHPSRIAFFLLMLPPLFAIVGSTILWAAKWKGNLRWQKIMSVALIVFPVITAVPLFIWK